MLSFEDSADSIPIFNEFMAELARRGYREDVNLKIVRRNAALDGHNFDRMALDLVEQKPDLIVTTAGTASVQAAKKATSTIPIVMMSSVEPVRDGLVASLARPGGNLTGNSLNGIELHARDAVTPEPDEVRVDVELAYGNQGRHVGAALEADR